jgi:triosephosphate isomerase
MAKLIAGNWKMNGLRADGVALAAHIADWARAAPRTVDIAVFPPATLIAPVAAALEGSSVALGGQDCHSAASGAHTGDISAAMLSDLGCRYVILGHSERRQNHRESDELVAAKANAAIQAGLVAIVCVGETEQERDRGDALAVVARQIAASLPSGANAGNVVIAYEPVWAIGTGRTAASADVAEVHAAIHRQVATAVTDGAGVRILYGGSVKPDNARKLLTIPHVDGALVGGASLDAGSFTAIAASAP